VQDYRKVNCVVRKGILSVRGVGIILVVSVVYGERRWVYKALGRTNLNKNKNIATLSRREKYCFQKNKIAVARVPAKLNYLSGETC